MSKRPREENDDAPPAKRPRALPDDELPERCTCIVCTEPCVQPFGCRSCFNSVCGACARRIAQSERPACPCCRHPVVYDQLMHTLAAEVEERLGAAAYAQLEAAMGPRPAARPPTGVPVVQRDGRRVTVGVALDEGTAKISFTLGADHSARILASVVLLPPERTPTQHIASHTDLDALIRNTTHIALGQAYIEYRDRYPGHRVENFDVYYRSHYARVARKVMTDLTVSFSGITLVYYLNTEYTNAVLWLSAFRVLYPLVSDKENDIAALVAGREGIRRKVVEIVRSFNSNRAIVASVASAAAP